MCGLLSIVTKTKSGFSQGEVKAFTDCLYMDALRGEDATGVILMNVNGATEIIKDNKPSYEFLKSFDAKGLLNRALISGSILIGHNRKRTIGADIPENAHPFVVDDRYAFVHNGTLINHKEIGSHDVDSESLAYHLTQCEGDKEKLEEALGKVYGAYACIWIDAKTETLYWIRNAERPLWMAEIPSGLILMSEPSMMIAACHRNNIIPTKIFTCEVNKLYSIKLNESSAEVIKEDLAIKKHVPPLMGAAIKALGYTPAKEKNLLPNSGVSKNGFKNLRKRMKNKAITFWLDDYIEKHYPNVTTEWLIFGSSTVFNQDGMVIQGELTGVTEYAIKDEWESSLCSAIIDDMVYDAEKKTYSAIVKDIKLVPKSLACH